MTSGPKVEVSRKLLLALGAALVACLAGLAFFLGRESGRGTAPAPPPLSAAGEPPAETADAGAAPEAAATPFGEAPPAADAPPAPVASTAAQWPEVGVAAPPPADAGLRDGVMRYFQEVEAIEASAKYWSDPQALARTLLEQGASGDSSGFDRLLTTQKQAADRLRGIDVPAPCAEHHRQTLALMDSALSLLQRLKSATGGDEAGLSGFVSQGRELEQRAKQVDALAAEIKRRHGAT